MYTVIFHRQAYSGDEGDSDELFKVTSCRTESEATQFVIDCIRYQVHLECLETSKYSFPRWKHSYGDFGFLVLYNGIVLVESSGFGEQVIDFTSYDKDIPIPECNIDIPRIMLDVTNNVYRLQEIVDDFILIEKDVRIEKRTNKKLQEQEEKERAELMKLLEKYPDMVRHYG